MRTCTGSDSVGQMPKPCARAPCTSSFSLPLSLPGRFSTTRLVMFEVTSQPMASTAWRSAFS